MYERTETGVSEACPESSSKWDLLREHPAWSMGLWLESVKYIRERLCDMLMTELCTEGRVNFEGDLKLEKYLAGL